MNKKTLSLVVALMVVAFLVPTSSAYASPKFSLSVPTGSFSLNKDLIGEVNYDYEAKREELAKYSPYLPKCRNIRAHNSATFPICMGKRIKDQKTSILVNVVSYNEDYVKLFVKGYSGTSTLTIRKGIKTNFRLGKDGQYIQVKYEGMDIGYRALVSVEAK
jgi:hypothetical protein